MAYQNPLEVTGPQGRWKDLKVISDNGEDNWSYAIGFWDGMPRMASRWNGNDIQPKGSPNSSGHATWELLDPALEEAVLTCILECQKRKHLAFLSGKEGQ